MHILLSNDDGYLAPGLAALHAALAGLEGVSISVVAPERNCSGASNSLTLSRPLTVSKAANGFHFVNGTPTDCVHIALTGLLETPPDIVVSGINNGQNMGEDTLYSGTVAAATEGFLFGLPSFAFSLVDHGWRYLDVAAQRATALLAHYAQTPLTGAASNGPILLNVNIPNRPPGEHGEWRITRLGKRHPSQPVIRQKDPRGQDMYWIGAAGDARDASAGTDFHAVGDGHTSITPLQLDLTHTRLLPALGDWIRQRERPV